MNGDSFATASFNAGCLPESSSKVEGEVPGGARSCAASKHDRFYVGEVLILCAIAQAEYNANKKAAAKADAAAPAADAPKKKKKRRDSEDASERKKRKKAKKSKADKA